MVVSCHWVKANKGAMMFLLACKGVGFARQGSVHVLVIWLGLPKRTLLLARHFSSLTSSQSVQTPTEMISIISTPFMDHLVGTELLLLHPQCHVLLSNE